MNIWKITVCLLAFLSDSVCRWHIHTHTHTYVHTYAHTHAHIYKYTHMRTHTPSHTHTHTHTHTRIHTHRHTHLHTHTRTHTHAHIHIHIHTHARVRAARTHIHTLSLSLSLSLTCCLYLSDRPRLAIQRTQIPNTTPLIAFSIRQLRIISFGEPSLTEEARMITHEWESKTFETRGCRQTFIGPFVSGG